MRTVDAHLLEDKMDEAVTHYINSHHSNEPVHIDTNGMPMAVQEDSGGRITVMHQQTYTTQMCRQVSVTEQVGEGPWGEELLEGPIAAIVAHLQNSRHHPPTHHKVAQSRTEVDSSVILDGSMRFNGQSLQQAEPVVVQLPPMQSLPPLQDMKRCADTAWFTHKNKKEDPSMLQESEGQVVELASSSPAHHKQQNRKSLPHKKRISRKLKRNNGNSTPQQEQLVVINCSEAVPVQPEQEQILPDNYVTVPHAPHMSHEVRPVLLCQECGEYYGEEQLKFYQHLKTHYEPHHTIIIENPVPDLPIDKMSSNCIVDNVATLPDSIVELSLENTVAKSLYQPMDKHALYSTGDKALSYNGNKVQYSMAAVEGAGAAEGDKSDLYTSLDKLDLYHCTKCTKTFRKQRHCEVHLREAHPTNTKLEDMGEFSEPEDLMAGIQVCVSDAILPHLTVENGQVHQDHTRQWYGRGAADAASEPCEPCECGVCARDHDTPYKLLKEEVLQRIFDSEVSDNANFADNMMSEHDVNDHDQDDHNQHDHTEHSHGHSEHVHGRSENDHRHNEHSHVHSEHSQGHHEHINVRSEHSQVHNEHGHVRSEHNQGHNEHSHVRSEHSHGHIEHCRDTNENEHGNIDRIHGNNDRSHGHNEHSHDHNEHSIGHSEHRQNEHSHRHNETHELNQHHIHNEHSHFHTDSLRHSEHSQNSQEHNDHGQGHNEQSNMHNDCHEHSDHGHEHNEHSQGHSETSQDHYQIIKQDEQQLTNSKRKHFFCTKCSRVFSHRNSLLYHLLSHEGKQHECNECGKGFYTHGALKIHRRTHNNDRPYKCDTCGRQFRQWSDLKYHINSLHSDKKQFKCEYCGKEFARKYSLRLHVRIHTGEKNYKCDHCDKTFRCSSYKLAHMRTHTGDRPYKCIECEKSFRSRFDLRRHSYIHDKVRNRFDEHKPKTKDTKAKLKMIDTKEENEETFEPVPKKIKQETTQDAALVKKLQKHKKPTKKAVPNVTIQNRDGPYKINDEYTNNVEVYDARIEYARIKNVYSENDRTALIFKEEESQQRDLAVLRPITVLRPEAAESAQEKAPYRAENTDGKMQVFTHVEKGKEYNGSIVSNAQVLGDLRGGRGDAAGEGGETGFLERLTAMYNIPAV